MDGINGALATTTTTTITTNTRAVPDGSGADEGVPAAPVAAVADEGSRPGDSLDDGWDDRDRDHDHEGMGDSVEDGAVNDSGSDDDGSDDVGDGVGFDHDFTALDWGKVYYLCCLAAACVLGLMLRVATKVLRPAPTPHAPTTGAQRRAMRRAGQRVP